MNRKRQIAAILTVLVVSVLLSGFACTGGTKKLALASDAISHALVNADEAAKQAVVDGVMTDADRQLFHGYVVQAAKTGMVLDQGIRANESATAISTKVNSFLDAFNQLQTNGLAGIKNEKLKLAISTIITGAEASVAVIEATVGGK